MTTEALVLRDPTPSEIVQVSERFQALMPSVKPEAWKALPQSDKVKAAMFSLAGFRPDHFTVMAYNTKDKGLVAHLHMNLPGREFNARMAMKGRYGGVECRPMTPDEQIAWKLDDDEVGAVATLYERDPNTGDRWVAMQDIGRAGGTRDAGIEKQGKYGAYQAGGNPIARANPQEQAMARARGRVLENGAPAGVPISTFDSSVGVIEVDTEQPEALPMKEEQAAIEGTATDVEPSPFDALETPENVDQETGEIEEPPEELEPRPDMKENDPAVMLTVEGLRNAGLDAKKLLHLAHRDAIGTKAVMRMLIDGHSPMAVVEAALLAQPEG